MKRIGFLTSVGLLALITASPLTAQSTEQLRARQQQAEAAAAAARAEAERAFATGQPTAQSTERSVRARQQQAEAAVAAARREADRAFAAGQQAYYAEAVKRGATNGVGVQPEIALGSPFWRNPEFAKTVGLMPDQQKKMEEVFQQHRLKLIDFNGALAKEESVLSALMADLRSDEEARVLGQIDRVAQVRTELEKANARMLLGLRQVLTTEQWSKLSTATASPEGRKAYRF